MLSGRFGNSAGHRTAIGRKLEPEKVALKRFNTTTSIRHSPNTTRRATKKYAAMKAGILWVDEEDCSY